jgi:hypothetical protein
MKEGKPFESVLDIARKENGKEDVDFTGVFEPDEEAVKAWATPLSQEYNGEFRYYNKSPMELRRLLSIETDEAEIEAINNALAYWKSKASSIAEAGEPYRGEERAVSTPESITAMVKDRKVAKHIYGDQGSRMENVDGDCSGNGSPGLEKFDGSGFGMVETATGVWEER